MNRETRYSYHFRETVIFRRCKVSIRVVLSALVIDQDIKLRANGAHVIRVLIAFVGKERRIGHPLSRFFVHQILRSENEFHRWKNADTAVRRAPDNTNR